MFLEKAGVIFNQWEDIISQNIPITCHDLMTPAHPFQSRIQGRLGRYFLPHLLRQSWVEIPSLLSCTSLKLARFHLRDGRKIFLQLFCLKVNPTSDVKSIASAFF